MTICFDMDGVLCDGRHLIIPPNPTETYLKLDPLPEARFYWNRICRDHRTYIVTARSYWGAARDIKTWLDFHCMDRPDGIIWGQPHFTQQEMLRWKVGVIGGLEADLYFDDHPVMYEHPAWISAPSEPHIYLVDNPHWSENQQSPVERVNNWKEIYATINNR